MTLKMEQDRVAEPARTLPVVVTCLMDTEGVDLHERSISPAQAADLRGRLSAFHEDWDDPEMDAYDEHYASR